MTGFPIIPREASTAAPWVDHLVLFELGVSAFFVVLIFALIAYFTRLRSAVARREFPSIRERRFRRSRKFSTSSISFW